MPRSCSQAAFRGESSCLWPLLVLEGAGRCEFKMTEPKNRDWRTRNSRSLFTGGFCLFGFCSTGTSSTLEGEKYHGNKGWRRPVAIYAFLFLFIYFWFYFLNFYSIKVHQLSAMTGMQGSWIKQPLLSLLNCISMDLWLEHLLYWTVSSCCWYTIENWKLFREIIALVSKMLLEMRYKFLIIVLPGKIQYVLNNN